MFGRAKEIAIGEPPLRQAIVSKIQRAADLSNENCDRAMTLAHKLSMQLKAAEDRINQLEAEVELFRDRAAGAER